MGDNEMQEEVWQPEAIEEDLVSSDEMEQQILLRMQLEEQFRNGINWFYWIAGLSIINTVLYFIGQEWGFIAGLGVIQVIDMFAYAWDGSLRLMAIAINFILAGIFVVLGYIARQGRNWVIIIGVVLYALDTIIFVFLQDWISIAFHGFAIYSFIKAIKANNKLKMLSE